MKKSPREGAHYPSRGFDPRLGEELQHGLLGLAGEGQGLGRQLLARGLGPTKAYERAGYRRNTGNAYRLKARPEVGDRVRELIESGARRAEVSVEQVLRERD